MLTPGDRRGNALLYDVCLELARDNWSELYYGPGTMGPRWPRGGANLRVAFWAGYRGQLNRWVPTSQCRVAWRAGRAFRAECLRGRPASALRGL